MTDDVRNLIRFVVDGDIRNAQTQCRIMLEKNVPEKDARFKETELKKLNLLKPELIQLPANLESLNKNVPSRGIYSNYGVPLKELRYDNTGIINKDTTIVMLGDCRNNRNYSGVEDVEWLSKRASNFFVLNPEPRDEWGQGDSIADLYAKSGAVVSQVSSAKDLLTFLQSAGTTRHF